MEYVTSDLPCYPDDLPDQVEDDRSFSGCDNCEFCISSDAGSALGGMLSMSRGTFRYCEKGYWKEDT